MLDELRGFATASAYRLEKQRFIEFEDNVNRSQLVCFQKCFESESKYDMNVV